jgi:multimeric flavodoxin WrbA
MKILGISGSPRKDGNTDIAVKLVLAIIKETLLDVETEFLQITDYNIKYCKGCRYCIAHVECIIKDDDLELLVGKMHGVNLLLFGAPIYWYGPPGVFKNFIDRTHAFYPDDTRFKDKKIAVITVAADSGFSSHEKIMSWMEYYGADYINWTRLFAREKGEIAKKSDEMEKLRVFASDLVLML